MCQSRSQCWDVANVTPESEACTKRPHQRKKWNNDDGAIYMKTEWVTTANEVCFWGGSLLGNRSTGESPIPVQVLDP